LNVLDWGIVVIVVVSILLAVAQGFFFEIFSLAGAIIGYVIAAWSYKSIAPWFLPYVKNDWIADGAAFLVIFLVIVILAGIIARLARWAIQEVGLRWFDRFLGGVFGAIRGALVVMAVVMAMASFAPSAPQLQGSQLAPYFLVLGRGAMWLSPTEFRMKFRAGLDALRKRNSLEPTKDSGQQTAPKSSVDQQVGEKK
jgi:membrane protein required for colicin V production